MAEPIDYERLNLGAETADDPIEPSAESNVNALEDPVSRGRAFDIVSNAARSRRSEKENKTPKPEKEEKKLPPRRRGSLVKPLEEMYVTIGMAVMAFDEPCGIAITNSATRCAEALDNLAYENDAVRRVIMRLIQTSAWGGVVMAHSPIIMAIAVHHVPGAKNVVTKLMAVQASREAEDYLKGETE